MLQVYGDFRINVAEEPKVDSSMISPQVLDIYILLVYLDLWERKNNKPVGILIILVSISPTVSQHESNRQTIMRRTQCLAA